jgi:hypothetical protein
MFGDNNIRGDGTGLPVMIIGYDIFSAPLVDLTW